MKKYCAVIGLCCVIFTIYRPFNAIAQTEDVGRVLEEVVVTATKRESNLQDAPLSVSAVPNEKIRSQGMSELEDLTLYIPNVHIAEGGTGTQLFIRGIGSGINYGFEQSVGIFIDGVYFGRGRSARSKFLDVERVEILKGPQSVLFGKNTIAGAVNITTHLPTTELERYIDDRYQIEFEGRTLSTLLSGELTENLAGRFVARIHKDDGYVENTYLGDSGPKEDSWAARLSLLGSLASDIEYVIKLEHADIDVLGRQDMISIASPNATLLYQLFGDPNFEADFNYEKSTADFSGSKQYDDTESDIIQLTIDAPFGEHDLRSISAYTSYTFDNVLDGDYGPLAFIEAKREEHYNQTSQEFLLQSPDGQALEYLLGVYYHQSDLDSERQVPVAFSVLPPIETALLTPINAALMTSLGAGSLDSSSTGSFKQRTAVLSSYAQFIWHHNDVFRSSVGIRFSQEHKDMKKSYVTTDPNGNPDDLLALIYDDVLNFSSNHYLDLDRTERHWTGNVGVQYDIRDNWMTYLNIANGVKAGGFDESNSFGVAEDAEFEDEYVESIEWGAKAELFDGRARFNIAWFHSEFDDVQVSTFDGNAGFIVGNAASSTVEGVELDIESVVTESTNVFFSVAYLDAYYTSFPDAACNTYQIVAAVADTGSRTCQQDLSGKPLQFSPTWSANMSLSYMTWVMSKYVLNTGMDINWVDDTVVANDHDPNLIQDSYYKVNGFVQVNSEDEQWFITLVGKNLTNEKTFSWGNDVPLGSLGFDFTYFKHIDPPRTIELQVRYHY
ncbi:hypothetical protein A9Q99_12815 [Gammaproteobacteria bacterium 45_16_T64]|nr:hypothetical protein A9Q99_12815 [Gammaproteobacteria bacterium 45_16_T64]